MVVRMWKSQIDRDGCDAVLEVFVFVFVSKVFVIKYEIKGNLLIKLICRLILF